MLELTDSQSMWTDSNHSVLHHLLSDKRYRFQWVNNGKRFRPTDIRSASFQVSSEDVES